MKNLLKYQKCFAIIGYPIIYKKKKNRIKYTVICSLNYTAISLICNELMLHSKKQTAYSTRSCPQHHTHTLSLSFMSSHQKREVKRENRQARVALEDRMKYSLQLTALRLNPRRLRGVQALT